MTGTIASGPTVPTASTGAASPRDPGPNLAHPATTGSGSTAVRRVALELACFAGLGALGALHWSRLVAGPPIVRLLVGLALVTAAAALLSVIAARRPRPRFTAAAAVAVIVLATLAAMVVVGLPARLLAPGAWPELADNLSRGLAGIEDTEMPYDGGDEWLRLTLLLFVPLLLGIAAALGFWPARRRTVLRVLALGVLVALYGVAVTLDSPGAELLWGVPLLVLVVGWLWVPALEPRAAAVALAIAGVAGIVALPLAARLDPAAAWWDYESWDWFGRDSEVTFDWDHSYGPLPWPDQGTTLLEVRSARPVYWKASVLDRFDGFTWQRARPPDLLATAERAARRRTPGAELPERNPAWRSQASFEVRALSSGLVIGAGTPQAIQGLDDVVASADGTLRAGDQPLRTGDEYSLVSYVPQPTVAELRAAPASYPPRRFEPTTLVALPAKLGGLPGEFGLDPSRAREMPLWGERPDAELRSELLASPYGATYRLARRLVAGAETPYEAVRAVERHLRNGYDYSPNVPQHAYPLAGFLFEDRSGYCQQFAGTMGLMLRMVGIPSRVVSGFAPGSFDAEREVYEIRDTDAHSWVEAYFRGIGWVTFDPTPAAAPAASQGAGADLGTFFRGRSSVADQGIGRGRGLERALEGGELGPVRSDSGPWRVIASGALALVGALATAGFIVVRRRRRALDSGLVSEAQLSELRRALGALGWRVPADATLLALEARFSSRPGIAGYAAALRAHRYAAHRPAPPGSGQRRALREALAGGGGLRRRARALLAIPPGGPR